MSIEAVTKDYLVLHFAEFSGEDSARIDDLNATALLFVSEEVYGAKARYALMLFIAHLLKMSANNGAGGAIQSQSVGDLAETFAVPTSLNSLENTSYGQEFLKITKQKSAGIRPLFVG
jgi:hypothetical protein